jgi:hypothetical protein
MQGILRSHYKQVEEYLNKLQAENSVNQYCPYYETIFEHKVKLYEIYKNYREAFEQMAMITQQFGEHKKSVKRLVIMQKNKKKEILKLTSNSSKNLVESKVEVSL